ncbi:MAG TPA: hypothetical protein P5079_01660 [Elusimicrobiota bacterium]|nr:hypothetical protein [Elusimicrobiota bacterium]
MTNLAGEKSSDRPAPYGQSVAYAGLSKTHPRLTFNDFSLQYVGLREVPGPNNAPWKMTVYRFHVQAREAQQEILWSSGSGLIAPSSFVVGHVRYLLELKHSEKQGKLPDGFLVVSPAGEAISKEEAVEIARKDAGQAVGSLARYEILAHPRPNGWHVDFVHKKKKTYDGPGYVIGYDGRIVSKKP